MRILHVNKFAYRRGGTESYMLDLAELQRQNGHETAVFAMSHPQNESSPFSNRYPPHVEYDPMPEPAAQKLRAGALMLWNHRASVGLAEVIDEFRPDVAHLHNVYHQLSPSVLRPLRRRRVPAVMTLHDFKLVCPSYSMLDHGAPCEACLPHAFHNAALRRCKNDSMLAGALLGFELGVHRLLGAYGSVHTFVCPSRFVEAMMRKGEVYPDRLRHLPNFTTIPTEPAPDNASGPFLYVGRLAPNKAIEGIIDAVAALPAVHLEIAGDGPERVPLEQRAHRVAPDRIRFLGPLDRTDVAATMSRARAVVQTSRAYENQPMTILEAMALGVPVVATSIGGIPELVEDGVTGRLVPANHVDALRDAMRELADEPDAARAMGLEGRRRVMEVHAPEVHLAALHDIYASAAASLQRADTGTPARRAGRH